MGYMIGGKNMEEENLYVTSRQYNEEIYPEEKEQKMADYDCWNNGSGFTVTANIPEKHKQFLMSRFPKIVDFKMLCSLAYDLGFNDGKQESLRIAQALIDSQNPKEET